MDHLTLRVAGKQHVFYLFKDVSNRGEVISRVLRINENDLGNDSTNRTREMPIKLVSGSQTKDGRQ
jgi:hypothetical protein